MNTDDTAQTSTTVRCKQSTTGDALLDNCGVSAVLWFPVVNWCVPVENSDAILE